MHWLTASCAPRGSQYPLPTLWCAILHIPAQPCAVPGETSLAAGKTPSGARSTHKIMKANKMIVLSL